MSFKEILLHSYHSINSVIKSFSSEGREHLLQKPANLSSYASKSHISLLKEFVFVFKFLHLYILFQVSIEIET